MPNNAPFPFVSIVIPVFNDFTRLDKCLEALEKQSYSRDCFEIIVVDNNSSLTIEKVLEKYPKVVLVKESYPTLHAARNKGISIANGDIFAFTDADCLPDDNWLVNGVKAIVSSSLNGIVGGRIIVFPQDEKKPTGAELFEMLTEFDQRKFLSKWHFAATANVFTTRAVMDKVGILDGALKSGADMEWGRRVFTCGYDLVYADDAIVRHPARHTIKQVIGKHKRVVGGLYDMECKNGYSLKKFLIDIKDDWPRGKDFLEVWSAHQVCGFVQRMKVTLVMALVKWARLYERIRLRFGGVSRRS